MRECKKKNYRPVTLSLAVPLVQSPVDWFVRAPDNVSRNRRVLLPFAKKYIYLRTFQVPFTQIISPVSLLLPNQP